MNKTQILVVEDDSPIRNLITTTLKTNNYRYLTAVNGESAISQTASHNPDIILLDLGLPDIDGVEVIKKIRTWTNTPIIVIPPPTCIVQIRYIIRFQEESIISFFLI